MCPAAEPLVLGRTGTVFVTAPPVPDVQPGTERTETANAHSTVPFAFRKICYWEFNIECCPSPSLSICAIFSMPFWVLLSFAKIIKKIINNTESNLLNWIMQYAYMVFSSFCLVMIFIVKLLTFYRLFSCDWLISRNSIQFGFNAIKFSSIQFNSILFYSIQFNTIKFS